MSLPTWPAINYYAAKGTWQLAPSDGRSRSTTDMDAGPVRTRRRFTRTYSRCSFTLELTDDENARFDNFYKYDLQDGTYWFMMPIFTGREYRSHMVMIDPTTTPTASDNGFRKVALPLSLIIRELYIVDDGTYYLIDTYGSDLVQSLFDVTEHFVDTSYPNLVGGFGQ